MFGSRQRAARADLIGRFHAAIVAASRAPELYGPGALPDTVEGRFESLTLHVLLVLRRLRGLPAPAADVAQELVDAVFAHLEIALRESGIGDFGVPKRMKKLGRAFYDRTAKYEDALAERDAGALAKKIEGRLSLDEGAALGVARYCLESEAALAACDLDRLLAGPPFARADDTARDGAA